MATIVFDIGGTNMRVASAEGETLGEIKKIKTPQDPDEAVSSFIGLAREVAGGKPIGAVAGAIRWIVRDGVYLPGDKALPDWGGRDLGKAFSEGLGAPVRFAHDTALIGLGEVHRGAAVGSKICAYVTVSSGVGGDRIVDGKVDTSVFNPEMGHQMIGDEKLEDLISGLAVKKRFGIEPKDLDSIDERNKLADILAVGLYNTVLHWSPDTIVLGGSMIIGKNPIPLDRTEASLKERILKIYPECPRLAMAALGDNGGLVGAAIYASQ